MTLKLKKKPQSVTKAVKPQARVARADGDNTRQQILETAGQLFAELGYGNTTSKLICEACGCNHAAVNYHFGSRDGLYSKVLVESHQRLIGLNTLMDITSSNDDPHAKLSRIIDTLLDGIKSNQWHARLFIREIMAPSEFLDEMIKSEALPKFSLLRVLISEITGIDADNPATSLALLSSIGPCMLLLIANRDTMSQVVGNIWDDPDALKAHIKNFLFAGLEAMRLQHEKTAKVKV